MQKHHLQCRVKKKRKWKSQEESVIVASNLIGTGTELYHSCPKREMGDGYHTYSVRKLDTLSVDDYGPVQQRNRCAQAL